MNNFKNAYRCVLMQLNAQNISHCLQMQQYRAASLYSASSLGIDKYTLTRERVSSQMHGLIDKFRSKMIDFTKEGSNNMIFTEDLKSMAHITEKSDLELFREMIKKFSSQNKELRFGSYVFGPVIMRMYHYLNQPDEALKVFKESLSTGFFDQLMSFHVLMDLLYKNEMYNEVLEIFEYVKSKQTNMIKYPKHIVVLAMASCYKQNTEESLKYASKLWSDLFDVGHLPMRRAATFLAGLALNQGVPHVALEVVSTVKNQRYISVRNIKVCAMADLNRPDDALPILRSVIESDSPEGYRNTFTLDVINRVKVSVDNSKNKEVQKEFERIIKALDDRKLIDSSKTLNDILCQEITIVPANNMQTNQNQLHTSYQNQNYRNRNVKQGLRDMY